jgi:ribosomal protein S12 methylthiotransferase accessory factor
VDGLSSLEENLKRCERGVDNRTGLITSVSELASEPDDPKLFYYSCTLADVTRYLYGNFRWRKIVGGGVGLTRSEAKIAAIAECIERYCCMVYDSNDLILASYNELTRKGLLAANPSEFALFSEEQYNQKNFPFIKFTNNTRVNWTWGYSLIKKKPILVPACMVFMPYVFPNRNEGEAVIAPTISTGLSCRPSYDEAILYGIFEVVERDAAMLTWYLQLSPPRIDFKEDLWLQEIFSDRFSNTGLEFHLFDITTDINIPTVFGLCLDKRSQEAAAVASSATHFNPQISVLKALFEIAQVRVLAKNLSRMNFNYSYEKDFSDVVDFDNHVHLYTKPEMLHCFNFLLHSSKIIKIDEMKKKELSGDIMSDLHHCINLFTEKSYDVIVVNLTTEDVKDLGFFVVKVIIPQLQPMNGDHNYRFLGGKRLCEYKKLLEHKDIETKKVDLNPFPHPFS